MIRNRDALTRTPAHGVALDAITAGIEAAHPETVVAESVSLDNDTLSIADERYDLDSFERVLVLGGGKPAGAVAAALETVLGGHIDDGAVVTSTPADTERITVHEGSHPLPSAANVRGTDAVLDWATEAGPDDLVLAVITGGASALLCAPVEGIAVEGLRTVTDDLLEAGVTIDELNAVRKHLSRLKGGQLARELAPATTAGLVFSDVVGNPLDVIASGPTAADGTTYDDALTVLERYDIDVPSEVRGVLDAGTAGKRPETPDAGADIFENVTNLVLAENRTAVEAATAVCDTLGYEPVVLSTRIEGEAREVGRMHAAIALETLASGHPAEPPVALVSGGETTVTVRENGQGGPNQEVGLAAAVEIGGQPVVLASVDTDGIDGPTDAAGAVVDGRTVGADLGTARERLDTNDVYGYLAERDALVETGATGTNVNDLRVVLVGTPRK